MTPDRKPIDRLVQNVRSVILRSSALFGFVFELTDDGQNFLRGCPLVGTIRDEATLQQYFKPLGNDTAAAYIASENRLIEIKLAAEMPTPTPAWYAAIVTQQLDCLTGVVVAFEFKDKAEAIARLRELESTIGIPRLATKNAVGKSELKVRWDRILETCVRTDQDALIIVDFAPFLRSRQRLRPTAAPVVTPNDLDEMLKEVASKSNQFVEFPGLRLFDVTYGDSYKFRIAALGEPDVRAVAITRLRGEPIPLSAINSERLTTELDSWIVPLKDSVAGNDRDAILIHGAPALTWGTDGVYPVSGPVLTSMAIRSCMDRIVERSDRITYPDGHLEFGISLSGEPFRAAMFGYPILATLVLIRLATPETSSAIELEVI